MPRAYRHILPALLFHALLIFGPEALAAQHPPAEGRGTAEVAAPDADSHGEAPEEKGAESAGGGVAQATSAPRERVSAFVYRAPSPTAESPQDTGAQQSGGAGGQSGVQAGGSRPPLTAGQKMKRSLRNAFLSPTPYAFSAFAATITQAGEDELPDKDFEDEFGDWASRFARTFATRTSRTILTNGVYASLFRQDPRYHRPRHKGLGGRLLYAVSRVVVTRDDDGNPEPNYSRFAGSFTASALANAYERSTPGHDRKGVDATFKRFGLYFATDAAANVIFRELVPTIFGR